MAVVYSTVPASCTKVAASTEQAQATSPQIVTWATDGKEYQVGQLWTNHNG